MAARVPASSNAATSKSKTDCKGQNMKATDAFPSKYISASDLGGQEVTVKITHIAPEEIGGKQKYICYFAGKKKGLVLNKTNWNTIARISGRDDTDDWTGVEIC